MIIHKSLNEDVHVGDNGLFYFPLCTSGIGDSGAGNTTHDWRKVTCKHCLLVKNGSWQSAWSNVIQLAGHRNGTI